MIRNLTILLLLSLIHFLSAQDCVDSDGIFSYSCEEILMDMDMECDWYMGQTLIADACPASCGITCCDSDGIFSYSCEEMLMDMEMECDWYMGQTLIADACPVSCDSCPSEDLSGCDLPDMSLSILEDGSVLYNTSAVIGGFEFVVDGDDIVVNGASGGAAEEAGFTISSSVETNKVLGFSLTGSSIPPGCGTLVEVDVDGIPTGLTGIVISDPAGNQLEFEYVEPPLTDGCALPDLNLYVTSSGSVLYNSSAVIGGFEFVVDGDDIVVNGASGGAAEEAGFTISSSVETNKVLGFSLTGSSIPPGCGTLVEVDVDGIPTGLTGIVMSDLVGGGLEFEYYSSGDILGCMDELACNYDPDVTEDDGSCEYAQAYHDCAGNCTEEIDCDGVCAGSAIADCNGDCNGALLGTGIWECSNPQYNSSGSCNGTGNTWGQFGNDECDECGGPGIPDGQCDCDGNVEDCAGECGGSAEVDECGVCEGDGIADGACDCDGNVDDACGVCGGDGSDDQGCGCFESGPSGCDNACGSTLEDDACGVCGGDGSDDQGCGCFESGPSGCDNACGSTLEDDACGVCGGDGSDDQGCGCFESGPSGCDNACGSTLENDECGVCGGDGSSCTPAEFQFNSSTQQAFYYFASVTINGVGVDAEDWVGAFNGAVCVGARKWDTSLCGNEVCDIPVMGADNYFGTDGYMMPGDIPTFKIFDASENAYYDAVISENGEALLPEDVPPWFNFGLNTFDLLSADDVDISGCTDPLATNYNPDADYDDDSCQYNFDYNQSTMFAVYFFEEALIDGFPIEEDDHIVAYKSDSLGWPTGDPVGGGTWIGEYTDVVVMGDEGSEYTTDYLQEGDVPAFRIYSYSINRMYDARLSDGPFEFSHLSTHEVERIEAEVDCCGDLGGHAVYYCGYCVGWCGNAEPGENDADGDLICDDADNCIDTPNPDQEDSDADDVGDLCDVCQWGDDNYDDDDDGIPNDCDFSRELTGCANLVSFWAIPEDNSFENMLSQCDITAVISDGRAAIQINETWYGHLTEGIFADEGYWLISEGCDEDCLLEIEGIYTNFQNTITYDLQVANNLISYPFSIVQNISEIEYLCEDGILEGIIAENSAMMCQDERVVGSLMTFEPSYGYWFRVFEPYLFQYYPPETDNMGRVSYKLPLVPDKFHYNQSSAQAFYFIEEITLTDGCISETDWIIAYHNETVIGARMWNGKFTDIPVMGSNDTDGTIDYATPDIIPNFKLYRTNSNQFIDLDIQNIPAWQDLGIFSISLSELVPLPDDFILDKAYPNPFNPVTTLYFALPMETEVSLKIYNLQGREVISLINQNMDAGYHSVIWNADIHSSGVYFVKMVAGSHISTQKLMLVK